MNKKELDEKYSYQIDEHNVVHLFRREENCQQYLTNPLLSAIFKIETLEKKNAELEDIVRNTKAVDESFALQTIRLAKAKNILKYVLNSFVGDLPKELGFFDEEELKALAEAEQFLKETEE